MEKWTGDNFPENLNDLIPKVREKAIEIANQLLKSGKYNKEEAIHKAIQEAEEWYYESEG